MNYAYAQSGQHVSVNTSAIDSVMSASLVVQLTLLLLIGLSIACWGIILLKRKQFLSLRLGNRKFLDEFWKTHSLDSLFEKIGEYKTSSVAQVFSAGFVELQRIAESNMASKRAEDQKMPRLQGIDNLARSLQRAADIEISKMEKRMTVLATTGSTGPFIGLFGTVWGIMGAFHKIGQTGAASLAIVAPGISEALIATAIGLAAAIPAVVAYNHFISKLKKEELEIQGFTSDFLNIVKRNFFKDE